MAQFEKTLNGKYLIRLTLEELALGLQAGIDRFTDSRKRGLDPGESQCSIETDQQACLSELAVALLLGQDDFIPSIGSYHELDIHLPDNRGLQVRNSQKPHGSLIVRPGDNLDQFFILATGFGDTWTIHGLVKGSTVPKTGRKEYFGRSFPCWLKSQDTLIPAAEYPWLQPYLVC